MNLILIRCYNKYADQPTSSTHSSKFLNIREFPKQMVPVPALKPVDVPEPTPHIDYNNFHPFLKILY